jgi:TatD DNase family protein
MPKLFDTHAHVNFNAFKDDADEVIKRSLDAEVFMVNVGSQHSTSARAVKIANNYDNGIYAAIGLHPIQLRSGSFSYQDDEELTKEEIATRGEELDYEKYLQIAKDAKVVAIGEVGLDYHHFAEGDDVEKLKEKQKDILIEFINLANNVKKPVIIHCWDAYDDLLAILNNYPVDKKGVIHSFIGGYKTAKKFIEMGYKIGLNGIITYGISYDRLIQEIDLQDIILETDCPYLAPVPKKGERNEPIYVRIVANKIAEIKEISFEEVAQKTTENAIRLFNMNK